MAFRRLSSLLVAITLAVTLTTSVFSSGSSSDNLISYTLSVDEMSAFLSSMSCVLTVTDASQGNAVVYVGNVPVTRRSFLDNDYLFFSAPSSGFTGSEYRLNFTFTPINTSSSDIINSLYSLDVDVVGFFANSSTVGSSFFSHRSLSFTPVFRTSSTDLDNDYQTSNASLNRSPNFVLGNGVTVTNAVNYSASFTPSSLPSSLYSFTVISMKPETYGVGSYPYFYVGIKPFTFTAPDETVDEIISALDDIKQSIDDNAQSIIDNQNKNEQAMEDFLGTPSSEDEASQSELDSNISASEDKMNEVQEALDSVEKPDLDQFDFDITNNDYYDKTIVSGFQSLISNSLIINMLLIVVMVIFIAYILFGKTA